MCFGLVQLGDTLKGDDSAQWNPCAPCHTKDSNGCSIVHAGVGGESHGPCDETVAHTEDT